jgi:hypothetical protein
VACTALQSQRSRSPAHAPARPQSQSQSGGFIFVRLARVVRVVRLFGAGREAGPPLPFPSSQPSDSVPDTLKAPCNSVLVWPLSTDTLSWVAASQIRQVKSNQPERIWSPLRRLNHSAIYGGRNFRAALRFNRARAEIRGRCETGESCTAT